MPDRLDDDENYDDEDKCLPAFVLLKGNDKDYHDDFDDDDHQSYTIKLRDFCKFDLKLTCIV